MDKRSQHSKRVLPNTPRVSDKIMEYYQKFGQDRDLEKFMRLYSPASSQDSDKTQGGQSGANTLDSHCKQHSKSRETISLTTSSCEALAMMPSRPLNICGAVNSKSMPNIVVVQVEDVKGGRQGEYFSGKDVIVDINIETQGEKEKIISISTENLETPKKTFKNITTQTPESVAKSHRRLEWDSLGDVGYKKSMSTSNISTIERSLLKEYFKENSVVSEPGTTSTAIKPPPPLTITEEHKTVKKLKAPEIEHTTPPLACSTLVEPAKRGAKPKMITKSTSSTSLHEKFEKYAQTSFIKPPILHSQEIQCSMSSTNSIIEGTATPSSFEYYSSRSSKSRTSSNSSDLLRKHIQPLEQHPFITSITDLLMKRKALGEKNQQTRHQFHNIRELQTKFQAALDENKENQTHCSKDSSTANTFSLSKQAPELDLGIQLICSLIDAKSVNGRQKKQLIRDIVKRLTRLEGGEQSCSSNSTLGTINSSGDSSAPQHGHIYDSVRSSVNGRFRQGSMAKLKEVSELGVTPILGEQNNKRDLEAEKASSVSSKSDNSNGKLETTSLSTHFQTNENEGHHNYKQFPCKTKNQCENVLKENNTNMSSATAKTTKINKETQSELINTKERSQKRQTENAHNHTKITHKISASMDKRITRSTQTSKTATSNSSTSVTTTPDLTTQKCIAPTNELNNSNTDAEQPTMREWLNPLTQSEIEYEEKKRQEMKKKAEAQKEKLMKKTKNDSGRIQQLNWIENEIKRLECLKHLLLKDETSNITDSSLESHIPKDNYPINDSTQTEKLYDTVYSDKSSVLSESAERLVKEIEIILEESHEDVINLNDNMKRTKDRKKEIQIIYEQEKSYSKEKTKKPKAKFHTLKESINISEEQLINKTDSEIFNKCREQREKIDTPSTEKSQETESLRQMVQQRKREFMEAYKTKKQNHYEALKQQQQKQDYKYLNIQQQVNENSSAESQHYSEPRTLTRKYLTTDASYDYTRQPLPLIPKQRETQMKTLDPKRTNISYNMANNKQTENKITESSVINTANSQTTTTTSSSTPSMFCMSSEVSAAIASTSTTSNYNDVSTTTTSRSIPGVAVQTSDSLLLSKPIYGPQQSLVSLKPHYSSTSCKPACVQVKPKGIAYVIEFNDNKTASYTDDNSNDLKTISKTNSNNSINSKETNNTKASEPQLTLQEHLEKSKPKFLQHSKERKAILNQLQAMRQERDRQLREIIDNTSFNSLERRLQYLPPPPIQKVRILNTKAMKALTNKRFSSLPEVVAKQEREFEEKKRRSNRILRDVFNRRLQKRVRNGKLSLNHSKTVI